MRAPQTSRNQKSRPRAGSSLCGSDTVALEHIERTNTAIHGRPRRHDKPTCRRTRQHV